MPVGQYVQSVLAFRLSFLNSLTRRVRVVAALAVTFQHNPSHYGFIPTLTEFETDLTLQLSATDCFSGEKHRKSCTSYEPHESDRTLHRNEGFHTVRLQFSHQPFTQKLH